MSSNWRLCAAILFAVTSSTAMAQSPTALTGSSPRNRTVGITIDDLPGAVPGSDRAAGNLKDLKRWNRGVLRTLRKHNAPALGLVIGGKLEVSGERDARAAILNDGVETGFDLGNHTYSHVHFQHHDSREVRRRHP